MTRMMLCSRCGALASLASDPPLCSQCAASMPQVPLARPLAASNATRRGRDEGFDPPAPPRPARTGAVIGFISSSLLVVASIYVLLTVRQPTPDDRAYPMGFLVLGLVGLAMALFAVAGTRRGAIANGVAQTITSLFWGAVLVAGMVGAPQLARGEWITAMIVVAALAVASVTAAAFSFRAAASRDRQ